MTSILLQCLAGVGLVVAVHRLLRWALRTVARPALPATDAEMRAYVREELLPPSPPPSAAVEAGQIRSRLTCQVCGSPVVVQIIAGPDVVGLFDRPGLAARPGDPLEPHRCPGWAIVRWARLAGMARAGAGREGRP